jgi:hypothetical protein
MCSFIIFLSLILFVLSGIIPLKALGIAANNTAFQNTAKAPLYRNSVIGYGAARSIDSNNKRRSRVKNHWVEMKLVPGDREF